MSFKNFIKIYWLDILFILIIFLPYLIIIIFKNLGYEFLGRYIGISFFHILFLFGVFLAILIKFSSPYPPYKTLSETWKFKKPMFVLRILIFFMWLMLLHNKSIPFIKDTINLIYGKESVYTIKSQVITTDKVIFTLPIKYQSIYINTNWRDSNYFYVVYSPIWFKENHYYEFTVLRHSRTIIDAKEISSLDYENSKKK